MTSLWRTVTDEIATYLDEALDISGKIDDFKTGVSEFFGALSGGQNIFQAMDTAFGTGVGDMARRLEEIFTDFGLTLLDVVISLAHLVDSVTHSIDVASIEQFKGTVGAGALGIDLAQARGTEDITEAIRVAIERGVTAEDIASKLSSGLSTAMESGDFDLAEAIAGNLDIIGALGNSLQGLDLTSLTGEQKAGFTDAFLGLLGYDPETFRQEAGDTLGEALFDLGIDDFALSLQQGLGEDAPAA
jgi:hypothetical protein